MQYRFISVLFRMCDPLHKFSGWSFHHLVAGVKSTTP